MDRVANHILFSSLDFKEEREYWTQKLNDFETFSRFPGGWEPLSAEYAAKTLTIPLSEGTSERMRSVSGNADLAEYVIFLTGVQLLLYLYSNERKISVAVPGIAKGADPHALFVVCARVDPSALFRAFLNMVKTEVQQLHQYYHIDFRKWMELTGGTQTAAKTMKRTIITSEALHRYDGEGDTGSDTIFEMKRVGSSICVSVRYHAPHSERQMRFIVQQLDRLLSHALHHPDAPLDHILRALSDNEKPFAVNFEEVKRAGSTTVPSWFVEMAKRYPERTAVVFNHREMTYRQLYHEAAALAAHLIESGITVKGNRAAILATRSERMVVAMVGVLMTGAAYIPLDFHSPSARRNAVLKEAGCRMLITDFAEETGEPENVERIRMDRVSNEKKEVMLADVRPADAAYILFTSGSTGRPKGVGITHGNLVNLVSGLREKIYGSTDTSRNVALVAPFIFDASVKQIYAALLLGHTLYIVPEEVRLGGRELLDFYRRNQIDISDCTPWHIRTFNDIPEDERFHPHIRHLLVGGEALNTRLLRVFFKRFGRFGGITVTNVYGPTECTDVTSVYTVHSEEDVDLDQATVPIGKPLKNVGMAVLNDDGIPIPSGAIGELHIFGSGVGLGYITNPALSRKCFVMNPYGNQLLYRTGDIVFKRWDGNYVFIGRRDRQVKIRGYRIELHEVETAVCEYPGIRQAIAVVKEVNKTPCLCVYFVSDTARSEQEETAIRSFLGEKLPHYLIPDSLMAIKDIPVTERGKVDWDKLPLPLADKGEEQSQPADSVEAVVRDAWREVLGFETIGLADNFFVLGGNSLMLMKVQYLIDKTYPDTTTLNDLYVHPTIRGISDIIRTSDRGKVPMRYTSLRETEKKEIFPASSLQKRLYVLSRLDAGTTAYHMPFICHVTGDLELDSIRNALQALMDKYEILRTGFRFVKGELMQVVDEDAQLQVSCLDKPDTVEIEPYLYSLIKPFDLSEAPLFRLHVVRNAKRDYYLVLDIHHMITDGVSNQMLIEEFCKLMGGEETEKAALQYRDFSQWQNRLMEGNELDTQRKYWLDIYQDGYPALPLPTDKLRRKEPVGPAGRNRYRMDEKLKRKLDSLCQTLHTTRYILCFTAYFILLSKYTGQEDLVVGTPVSGRNHRKTERIIGPVINTLAIRNYPVGNIPVSVFIKQVEERFLDAFGHQEIQYESLIDRLAKQHRTERKPLYTTMFVFNSNQHEFDLGPLRIEAIPPTPLFAKFDLMMDVVHVKEQMFFELEYRKDLYHPETIDRMAAHYIGILEEIYENPECLLKEIDYLSREEKNKLLHRFNETETEYPSDCTIHRLMERQADKTPDAAALIYSGRVMTYRTMNEKANRISHALMEKGIQPGCVVAVFTERCFEMMIGIFGILKAGAAYLPIMPDLPEERIRYMLEDSRAKAVLTLSGKRRMDWFSGFVLYLDQEAAYSTKAGNPEGVCTSGDVAYIIYTSGSTGKAKGVMIEHHSVINRLMWMQKCCPLTETDRLIQKTPYSFDVSVWELFWGSFYGAGLCLLPSGEEKNPDRIMDTIRKEHITAIHFVPSMFKIFLQFLQANPQRVDEVRSIRCYFSSGEELSPVQVVEFNETIRSRNGSRLINLYGPTEATVDVSWYECPDNEVIQNVPIGKPIDNVALYILGKNMELLPVGVPGELYIGGVCLARGYVNNAALTEKRFVDNPYKPGTRIYSSGDVAKWLEDGNIQYLGRNDFQVKIRGNRVETGEIENTLLLHPDVTNAVVVADENRNRQKYLCAYVTTVKPVSKQSLKDYLRTVLPDYMIPSHIIFLEDIPVNTNGKVDRSKLPRDAADTGNDTKRVPPASPYEKELLAMWKAVLETDEVGTNEHFFDIGGNSISLLELYMHIDKKYPGRLDVTDLFSYTTIAEMASAIDNKGAIKIKDICLRAIELTDTEHCAGSLDFREAILEVSVDEVLSHAFTGMLRPENQGIEFTCMAVYIYILAAFSGKQRISMQAVMNGSPVVALLDLNLEGVLRLEDLSESIRKEYERALAEDSRSIPVEQLPNFILRDTGNKIYPLFCMTSDMDVDIPTGIFDLILKLNVLPDNKLRILCAYNTNKLKKNVCKELLAAYVNAIKQIVVHN